MEFKNSIVVNTLLTSREPDVTINIDEITLSKLNYILNNLNIKHLPGYWTLEEVLKKEKIDKNEIIYSKAFTESCVPVLEHIKRQISRFYIFNLIEQKIIKNKTNDTDLEQLLLCLIDLVSVKEKNNKNVLTKEIISKLLISNINSIFNRYSISQLDKSYNIELVCNYDDILINKEYIDNAIEYVFNYQVSKININIKENQSNKKVYKI